MVRFSCSPTADMGVNELIRALKATEVAQEQGIDLVVHIDDLDKEKNIEKKDQEILDLLDLFEIPYKQALYASKNTRFHAAMALQLLHEKKAFNCFCSDEWLEKKMQEAKEQNTPYRYDDACKNLPPELVIDNTAPFRVRISGTQEMESFEILHQDKTPTPLFASAVDDMLNDISVVVCDEKELSNTSKEAYIREQLGYEKEVQYTGVQSATQNISLKELLERGYLPQAISNYLVSDQFRGEFEIEKLNSFNREYLKNLDPKELSRYVGFADEEIGKLAKLFLEDVATTRELKKQIEPIFSKREVPKELQNSYKQLQKIVQTLPYVESFDDFEAAVFKELGDVDHKKQLLSLLLCNTTECKQLNEVYDCLKNYIQEVVKK